MNYLKNGYWKEIITSHTCSKNPACRASKKLKPQLAGYTLIEILMVIVIMSLLMAAGMPAFVDMMKGQGVESSARNLGQVLKLARSHAINNREYVAVLIPRINLNDTYNFRSYRVGLVNKPSSGVYTFKRWLQGENWIFTSVGVAIVDIDNTDPMPDRASGLSWQPDYDDAESITAVNCDDIGLASSVAFKGIVFKPTGKATKASTIYIGEATGTGTSLTSTASSDADVSISVNEFTGRVTFED